MNNESLSGRFDWFIKKAREMPPTRDGMMLLLGQFVSEVLRLESDFVAMSKELSEIKMERVVDKAGLYYENTSPNQDKILEAAKPLIQMLNDNHTPHTIAIVTTTDVEILGGIAAVQTMEFVHD